MKKPANRCNCGQPAVVSHCYSTSHGHGFCAQCKGAHWGPWAKTVLGAKRLWNRDNPAPNEKGQGAK